MFEQSFFQYKKSYQWFKEDIRSTHFKLSVLKRQAQFGKASGQSYYSGHLKLMYTYPKGINPPRKTLRERLLAKKRKLE